MRQNLVHKTVSAVISQTTLCCQMSAVVM